MDRHLNFFSPFMTILVYEISAAGSETEQATSCKKQIDRRMGPLWLPLRRQPRIDYGIGFRPRPPAGEAKNFRKKKMP